MARLTEEQVTAFRELGAAFLKEAKFPVLVRYADREVIFDNKDTFTNFANSYVDAYLVAIKDHEDTPQDLIDDITLLTTSDLSVKIGFIFNMFAMTDEQSEIREIPYYAASTTKDEVPANTVFH